VRRGGGATSYENRCMHTGMTKANAGGSIRWIHEVKVEGALAFRAGKRGTEMIAQWPRLGTLTCRRDGSGATFAPVAGASDRALGKLQRAQVRGLLRDLAGQLAVHASAVAVEGHAVLFLGSDGAGKSTAAAEMCLGQGARMFADDAASLQVGPAGVDVVPFEEDHWLTRASCRALGIPPRRGAARGDKRELRASKVASDPCPLTLVVALRFDPSVKSAHLRPLRGIDAARLLLEAVIRFDVEDGEARGRELEQLMTVYNRTPFFELVRPLRAPGGVAAYVLDALAKGQS
jgi:hypothetical protein